MANERFARPKDTDWLRVTFDGEQRVCRDYNLIIKLAKRKNRHKKGDYHVSGNKVIFYEKKVIATWKHERFSDKDCTKRVKV